MKKLGFITALILSIGFLGLVGCSKKDGVDTSKVQAAFQPVLDADKADVDKAISLIQAGDYAGALTSLEKAAANIKITPEQKAALQDLITQVQNKVGEVAKKAVDDTSKALKEGADKTASDLQKAVGK